jgi:hypothetical protein
LVLALNLTGACLVSVIHRPDTQIRRNENPSREGDSRLRFKGVGCRGGFGDRTGEARKKTAALSPTSYAFDPGAELVGTASSGEKRLIDPLDVNPAVPQASTPFAISTS